MSAIEIALDIVLAVRTASVLLFSCAVSASFPENTTLRHFIARSGGVFACRENLAPTNSRFCNPRAIPLAPTFAF